MSQYFRFVHFLPLPLALLPVLPELQISFWKNSKGIAVKGDINRCCGCSFAQIFAFMVDIQTVFYLEMVT